MSKVAELAYDIEQMYIEGSSPTYIAKVLGCPVETVYDWLNEVGLDAGVDTPNEEFNPFETVNS